MRRVFFVFVFGLLVSGTPVAAMQQRPLDHDAYERWKTIDTRRLAASGRWLAYTLTVEWGDPELVVRATDTETEHRISRGADPRFAADDAFVAFELRPGFDTVRQLRRNGVERDDLPKDSLGILDLRTGDVIRLPRVRSFRAAERGPWIAYHLERERDTTVADTAPSQQGDTTAASPKKASETGTTLVVRHVGSGWETRIPHVTGYAFAKPGTRLAAALSSRDGADDGVVVLTLADTAVLQRIIGGRGSYETPVLDESGERVAFLTNRDETEQETPRFALYVWQAGRDAAHRIAAAGDAGVPAAWAPSAHRQPRFSTSGERVFFGTAPVRPPAPKDTLLDDERIDVDVWHWQDPVLQPEQLLEVEQERKRTYLAVVHLRDGRVVQLADPEVPEVRVAYGGDVPYAVAESEVPYRRLRSWDYPTYRDLYAVDLRSGERRLLARKQQARGAASPDGRWITWYDPGARAWFVRPTVGGPVRNATAGIPHPLYDEDHDRPYPASPYGSAGWTRDGRLLVYDRYDVWVVDPAGREPARNVTDGVGRRDRLQFRVVDLDPEEDVLDATVPLLLRAFHVGDKRAGFYRDHVGGNRPPERLVFMARRFSRPEKAAEADRLVFTRESVQEFPDLWVSDLAFSTMRKLSDANPQQAEYRWADVELVTWRSTDGRPLQGLLYTPEDFDPSQTYPMMVYFYERNADNLHAHYHPYAHRSVIRPTFYASRGYVVFIPDIVYTEGYPGESALDCVVPGVLSILDRGFVDPERIGVQGHSWGGYQIAYLVTRTHLFRAAAGGAPVANMTSAYGGIRWGSGLSRMFQYERTQSRIGGSLWETPLRYIENSPIFWADRVETPLLMMHNDEDGAVPWEQGIEMFVALRRLGKPAWLINYNGEPHWPLPFQKRKDWNIRMQQYFDHYLRNAPPAEWMVRGVPALEKGRTLGLELVTDR